MSTSISIILVGVLFYVRGIVDRNVDRIANGMLIGIVDRILIGIVDRIANGMLTTFALPSVSYVRGIIITTVSLHSTYTMINEDFMLL